MTAAEKRTTVVEAIKSREGKNSYTQGVQRTQVGNGHGDCSSTVQWCYNKIGVDIGDYTEAQLVSKAGKDVALTITNGVPDASKMLPGDLLFFRGASTVHATRTKNVGHVEMYVGNGQISGHPSGIGPTRKSLTDYCSKMQSKYSSYASPNNCGLICVRRYITGNDSNGTAPTTTTTTTQAQPAGITVGTEVQFTGTKHYASCDGPTYFTCSPCKAKVTKIAEGAPYPYHVKGQSVHGWVPQTDVVQLRTATIICTSLHIRQKPDNTSTSIGIMKCGDQITITGDPVNDWYPITWKGKQGYAKKNTSYIRLDG